MLGSLGSACSLSHSSMVTVNEGLQDLSRTTVHGQKGVRLKTQDQRGRRGLQASGMQSSHDKTTQSPLSLGRPSPKLLPTLLSTEHVGAPQRSSFAVCVDSPQKATADNMRERRDWWEEEPSAKEVPPALQAAVQGLNSSIFKDTGGDKEKWLQKWQTANSAERDSFRSLVWHTHMKLGEITSNKETEQVPNALRTSVVCELQNNINQLFGPYRDIMSRLCDSLYSYIYSDYCEGDCFRPDFNFMQLTPYFLLSKRLQEDINVTSQAIEMLEYQLRSKQKAVKALEMRMDRIANENEKKHWDLLEAQRQARIAEESAADAKLRLEQAAKEQSIQMLVAEDRYKSATKDLNDMRTKMSGYVAASEVERIRASIDSIKSATQRRMGGKLSSIKDALLAMEEGDKMYPDQCRNLLALKDPEESVAQLVRVPAQDILVRWINFQLDSAGHIPSVRAIKTDAGRDVFLNILRRIAPDFVAPEAVEAVCAASSPYEWAKLVVRAVEGVTGRPTVSAGELLDEESDARAFVISSLMQVRPYLPSDDKEVERRTKIMEDLDSCREALAVLEKMDLADIDSIEGIRTKFEPLVSQFQAVMREGDELLKQRKEEGLRWSQVLDDIQKSKWEWVIIKNVTDKQAAEAEKQEQAVRISKLRKSKLAELKKRLDDPGSGSVNDSKAMQRVLRNVVPQRFKDILPGLTNEERQGECDLIRDIFYRHRKDVKAIFTHYCKNEMRKAAKEHQLLQLYSVWIFAKDCQLVDSFLSQERLKLVFDRVNAELGTDGELHDEGDAEMDFSEFLEALVHTSYARYCESKGSVPLFMGLEFLLEQHSVLRLATKEESGFFRIALKDEKVARVLAAAHDDLMSIYKYYAAGDAESGADEDETMNVGEFIQLLRECALIDNLLPLDAVTLIFEYVQEDDDGVDDDEEDNEEDEGLNLDTEMVFSEFVEAISACAVMRNPDPYTPLSSKIESFIVRGLGQAKRAEESS